MCPLHRGPWRRREPGIAGKDDKRQITAVLAGTMSGEFLPPQLVYEGKTRRCIPKVSFPSGWGVTYTDNHWCNESTMKDYIHKIILPYVQKKRQELKLSFDYLLKFCVNFLTVERSELGRK